MKRALLAALLAWMLPASAANYTDIWWNRDEPGWGLTLAHHEDKVFGVWYVYDASGKAFWVAMSDGAFSGDGRSYNGTLYRTTGPSYNDPSFAPSRVATNAVGTARIDFDASETAATVTYTLDGAPVVRRVTRTPFGSAPANAPDDLSDIYWNPDESGWGLSLSHHGDTVFAVWYTYADDNQPAWLFMSAGQLDAAGTTITGKLYSANGGSGYSGPFDPARVKVAEVGSATIAFANGEARFSTVVSGKSQSRRVRRFAFGAPAAANAKPTVSLTLSAGASVAPATATLRATASDGDGQVMRVTFYDGSEVVGVATAAPFQATVSGLAAGKHAFSARATDDKGATRLATATLEVKASASSPAANKPPTISVATPAANALFVYGEPVALTANARDADGKVAKVEYFVDGTKVAEAAESPFTASWTTTPGVHAITATATDDKGLAAISAAVSVTVAGPAPAIDSATLDAARFLTQATFGIKGVAEIDALKARGYESWLAEQFALGAASHVQYVNDRKAAGEKAAEERAYEAIWQQWLNEPGQLRARTAFALSEIFVISNVAPDLDTYAMASYMDMLNRNAFGNYRQLLEEVTLHPAMGYYLNMIGSKKADAAKGTHPNENYAREVMQLFSIGTMRLNPDGTSLVTNGRLVPTYDQSVVTALAAALTGWSFSGNDTSNAAIFNPAKENWLDPLVAWEMWHDNGAKTLFDGVQLAANQGARKDLKDALDALFRHPNVGPFIGRRLIQRFVTSNPGPEYIARVAAAFDNNGAGVRGDLKAVVRAVLMDPEARDVAKVASSTWGKQREPVIRFANLLRAFNAKSPSGRNHIWYLDSADEGLNQSPLLSPTVFNFFSPDYRQPGAMSFANLVAPEFQVTTETSMVGTLNFFARLARNGSYGSGDTRLTLDLAEANALAAEPQALVDRLNLLVLGGAMSDGLRRNLLATLDALPAPKPGTAVSDRVKAALILISMSPDFAIQK